MRWENKNTCRWPVLLVISVPKIFLNGQFYFNLSSKTWSHVFFGTQCIIFTRMRHNVLNLKLRAVPRRLRTKSSTFIFLSARTFLLCRSVFSIMTAKARRNTVSGLRKCLSTLGLQAQYWYENAYNTNEHKHSKYK